MKKCLLTAFVFMLFLTRNLAESITISGPCTDELERIAADDPFAFQPDCTPDGRYKPKQCNGSTGECWCVGQCGTVVPGSLDSASLRCEEESPPCIKEYEIIAAEQSGYGRFFPRCKPDGFFFHTQCQGSVCFCFDQCGHMVPGSNHGIAQIRDLVCACPDDDHAFNCPTDPCEGAVCNGYPDAVCKANICGGCKAEFSVDGSVMDCTDCTEFNNVHRDGDKWQIDPCTDCTCENGLSVCASTMCSEQPHPQCTAVMSENACCPTFYCPDGCIDNDGSFHSAGEEFNRDPCTVCSCMPGAGITATVCRTITCDNVPSNPLCIEEAVDGQCCPTIICPQVLNAIGAEPTILPPTTIPPGDHCPPITCSNRCGPAGVRWIDGCETCECVIPFDKTTIPPSTIPPSPCPMITCNNACFNGERRYIDGCRTCECLIPFDKTTIPPTTTRPTPSPCPMITCSNVCGGNGERQYIDGCRTCECVITREPTTTSAPTTTPFLCPPVTCSTLCGPAGVRWVDGCETCECLEPFPRSTTPTPTYAPFTQCPMITCSDACGGNGERRIIGGCRSCECVVPVEPTTTPTPTAEVVTCIDLSGNVRAVGEQWNVDKCTSCTCHDVGFPLCIAAFCAAPSNPLCVEVATDTEECCPTFKCPSDGGCIDHETNKWYPENEVFEQNCQVCKCVQYGDIFCVDKPCPPSASSNPPPGCSYATPTGGCCPTRLVCMEPLSNCPPNVPVAMCAYPSACITEICEAYPDAQCSISFCGSRACQATFYDENNKEVNCAAVPENPGCIDVDNKAYEEGASWKRDACNDCICLEGGVIECHTIYCDAPPAHCTVDPVQEPDSCCPSVTCPQGCVDNSGNLRPINDVYTEACQTCTCTIFGEILCIENPCPPPRDDPPSGCQYVTPPGGCCPTRVACMEPFSSCPPGSPVAMCFSNACLEATCERYPDAICSVSFCGARSCQATFYDDDHNELDCSAITPPAAPTDPATDCPLDQPRVECLINPCDTAVCELDPKAECSVDYCGQCSARFYDQFGNEVQCTSGCVDEFADKFYKTGETYNDGCNDCTCMEYGGFACTYKLCECVDESTGLSHKVGDVWNDGCNDCTCLDDGVIACTEKLCEDEPIVPNPLVCDHWNHWDTNIGVGISRPRCQPDGTFSPKQCHDDGSCWCVNSAGEMLDEGSWMEDGSLVECVPDSPPCFAKQADNQQKVERGEPSTFDPQCDKDGYYLPEQCDPNINQCWCSERDGTVVIGSYRTIGVDLKCSKVCFGKVIPLLLSSKVEECTYHIGCPNGFFCHVSTEYGFARCCRSPQREP